MNEKILVTYASQGGSTAGIAEAIGQALTACGAAVDVRPVKNVVDLHPYEAVIAGSAVHQGKWMPEAQEFVERNRATLIRMPTAIFQVCLTLASDNDQFKRMVPDWLAPLRGRLHPLAEGSFAGALWPERYSKWTEKLGLRIFLASIHLKPGDYRDWNAVRAWSDNTYSLISTRG
jgi:menaquinone-dependent protoporphyrinogen oxidase